METIENIERAVDRLIEVVNMQLNALNEVKILLGSEVLKSINPKESLFLPGSTKVIPMVSNFNAGMYKDYPMNGKFPEKMNFLDKLHPQAWRLPERRELINKIEGEERAAETFKGEAGKMQNLRRTKKWKATKFGGVNKLTFYVRPEWITDDGKGILPQFQPDSKFLEHLPEEKRRMDSIEWLT